MGTEAMELTRWLDRFTETTDVLRHALDSSGEKEAAICAVVTCLGAADSEELSADMHAVSVFFPALLRRETMYFIWIIFDISSIALCREEGMIKAIDESCAAIDEKRITEAWQGSVWRKKELP
jgi:hypothetical protein